MRMLYLALQWKSPIRTRLFTIRWVFQLFNTSLCFNDLCILAVFILYMKF